MFAAVMVKSKSAEACALQEHQQDVVASSKAYTLKTSSRQSTIDVASMIAQLRFSSGDGLNIRVPRSASLGELQPLLQPLVAEDATWVSLLVSAGENPEWFRI